MLPGVTPVTSAVVVELPGVTPVTSDVTTSDVTTCVVGVRTSISPSTTSTLLERSNPSASLIKRSLIVTGIFEPGVASASILYVSSITVEPSGATCDNPVPDVKRNLALSPFIFTSAPYADLSPAFTS